MNLRDIQATCTGLVTCLIKSRLRPHRRLYNEIQKTQWFSANDLGAYQLTQLKRVIHHAYETVPYYTEMMNNLGIQPKHFQQLTDMQKFPVMTKGDLIQIGSAIISTRYNKLFLRTAYTGGTSGLPVPVKRDIISIAREHAFVRRQFDWAGVKTSDRCAYLMGRVVVPTGHKTARVHYYDSVMKELTLSTFHLNLDQVPHYVDLMKAYRIKTLIAYPSAAYILARGCRDRGLSMRLSCVMTTSETLDEMKKKEISESFECPVFDYYGSAERIVYIHTCEKGSYHIVPEYGYTELVPAEPPNEGCFRVVSTGFWNMAMPLIRYQMGDLVKCSGKRCTCGREFPVIDKIVGREGVIITTPSGVQLGASAVEYILERILQSMYHLPVLTGRVIYDKHDQLTLEYVPSEGFKDEHERQLQAVLHEQTPDGMTATMRRVNQLDRTPRGKFLSFVMNDYH
jgi:phenylacetate-CoA ligase